MANSCRKIVTEFFTDLPITFLQMACKLLDSLHDF